MTCLSWRLVIAVLECFNYPLQPYNHARTGPIYWSRCVSHSVTHVELDAVQQPQTKIYCYTTESGVLPCVILLPMPAVLDFVKESGRCHSPRWPDCQPRSTWCSLQLLDDWPCPVRLLAESHRWHHIAAHDAEFAAIMQRIEKQWLHPTSTEVSAASTVTLHFSFYMLYFQFFLKW